MRVAPAGQDLVRVGLVADVPDQPVVRRVEDVVQGHGQLDHAQPGAEMPAGHRDRVDRLLPQLGRQLHAGWRGRGGAGRWAAWTWSRSGVDGHRRMELSGRAVQDLRLITKSNSCARTVARPAKMSRRADALRAQLGQHVAAPRPRPARRRRWPCRPRSSRPASLPVAALSPPPVQQVVLDLEGEPEVLGIGRQRRRSRRPARARGSRRPRRRSAISAPVFSRCMRADLGQRPGSAARPSGRAAGRRTCRASRRPRARPSDQRRSAAPASTP